MIAFLKDCQVRHKEWAEYFEQNSEKEKQYIKTGEWDTAEDHRKIEKQYQRIIDYLCNR